MTFRVIFMGTPDFAVPVLEAIHSAGHEVVSVYTQPPRAAGRGMAERLSPVHECANARDLPIVTVENFKNEDDQKAFAALEADVAIVVAYGLILPAALLAMPKHGCFNLHASKLPRWRGAAPIQRAIMAGDVETANAVMRMEAGLDTGPICLEEIIAISPDMTAGMLHDQLAEAGAGLMTQALAKLAKDSLTCIPQPIEGVTYAKKIEKSEARIEWHRSGQEVHNMIRGLSPFPGAWFEIEVDGKMQRVKALESRYLPDRSGTPGEILEGGIIVACNKGAVSLVRLQRAGKQPMSADDFQRGMALAPGTQLN
ncbi:MAG: methionyl-tRNA formyltransferase [Rhizobiales bacterium]|nr:methionyl-tRNA formyltransferase [Hyphomicrobiales bacterium]